MNPKIKDEPYLMLPYGNLCVPLSMASELIKHSMYVDRNYSSELSDYTFTVEKSKRASMEGTIVDCDTLKAAMVASKLEKA